MPQELLQDFEKPVLERIKNYCRTLDRIIVIKGPRRTGKSTLLYQTIDSLLKEKKDPFDILYLSFDDPSLQMDMEAIFETYQEIKGETISATENKKQIYCFLDEVHFLENWQLTVKKYFDKKYPIKFFVTSSSASLFKKGLESLAGRTVEEIILPFSFEEFIRYSFRKDKKFAEFFSKNQIAPYENEIKILFKKYLSKGGFPHILSVEEPSLREKLLREDILEKAIYKDLVSLYGVREPQKLEKVFLYLADISGQILNVSSLAKNIGLTRPYVEKYLTYLEKAYLAFRFKNFSLSAGKKLRSPLKVYLVDSGLINLFGGASPDFILESLVARHLLEFEKEVYYFRNYHEVDFVVQTNGKTIPIEVKNKSKLDSEDFKGIMAFMEKFNLKEGLLLSHDVFGEKKFDGRHIRILPVWRWALTYKNIL